MIWTDQQEERSSWTQIPTDYQGLNQKSWLNYFCQQFSPCRHQCRLWDNLSMLSASVRTFGTLTRCPLSLLQGKWQHQLSGGRIYLGCSGKGSKFEEILYFLYTHDSRKWKVWWITGHLKIIFTLKRDEKTWKVWTAQEPSESVTSWLIWQRHASSASSHTVGWKAAKMAEKNGEGGGGKPRSSKSSTSSRKLLQWKWERNGGTKKKRVWYLPPIKVLYQ